MAIGFAALFGVRAASGGLPPAPSQGAVSGRPPNLDGVYFVDSPYQTQTLEIRGSVAEWPSASAPPWIASFEQDDQVLTFKFKQHTHRVTYAVLDGTLWIGVMLQRDARAPRRWGSLYEDGDGMSPILLNGPRSASWDEATSEWSEQLSRSTPQVHLKIIGTQDTPNGFWPIFATEPASEYGLPPACAHRVCPERDAAKSPFRRQGAVLITPWSVALGKVGIVSKPALADAVVGRWSRSGREGPDVVEFVTKLNEPNRGPLEPSALLQDVPEPQKILVRRAQGVYVTTWGPRCLTDRCDFPATATYVVLSADRILKRVQTSKHYHAGVVLQDEFLQRVKEGASKTVHP